MPRRRRRLPPADPEVPLVYDGYHGGFVQVDAVSFDVTLGPEAVVWLPRGVLDEQRAAAEALQRRDQARAARHARPRCDAGDHHVRTVTGATDGLLALCGRCSGGLELAALDSPAVIEAWSGAHPRRSAPAVGVRSSEECWRGGISRTWRPAASAGVRCAAVSGASCRPVTASCGPAAAVPRDCRWLTWTRRPRPKPWRPVALQHSQRLSWLCWPSASRRLPEAGAAGRRMPREGAWRCQGLGTGRPAIGRDRPLPAWATTVSSEIGCAMRALERDHELAEP